MRARKGKSNKTPQENTAEDGVQLTKLIKYITVKHDTILMNETRRQVGTNM